jgi:hypothetical protein
MYRVCFNGNYLPFLRITTTINSNGRPCCLSCISRSELTLMQPSASVLSVCLQSLNLLYYRSTFSSLYAGLCVNTTSRSGSWRATDYTSSLGPCGLHMTGCVGTVWAAMTGCDTVLLRGGLMDHCHSSSRKWNQSNDENIVNTSCCRPTSYNEVTAIFRR